MSTVSVSYRPLMHFAPLPRFTWRLRRVDGILQGRLAGHKDVTVTKWRGDRMFTCRCAGEEILMPYLHSAFLWCEHNLSKSKS